MITGIYYIKNRFTDKMYIGSSIDIDVRIKHHLHTLNNGTHSNSELQNDFNDLGECYFSFGLLATCKDEDLADLENTLIEATESTYNVRKGHIGRYQRTNPKRIQLGVRLPSDLILAIEEAAKNQNRTPSNFVETILKKELDLL